MKTPTTLIIMDGFGLAPQSPGNAVTNAPTPNLDKIFAECPGCKLSASGQPVDVNPGDADCTVCHGNVKASELIPDRMAALHGNCMKCHEKHGKGPFRKDQCNQCHTK